MLSITKEGKDVTLPLTAKVANVAQQQAVQPPEDPKNRLFGLSNVMLLSLIGHGYLQTLGQAIELIPALRQDITLAMSAAALLDRTIRSGNLDVESFKQEDVVQKTTQTSSDHTDTGTNHGSNQVIEEPPY